MKGDFRIILKVDGQYHPVDFCHKSALFGSLPVKQAWVDLRTLYEPVRAPNSGGMVSYFWGSCRAYGTAYERGPQETYLLARLLPLTRAIGSRRIVPDGRFGPARSAAYAGVEKAAVNLLRQLLLDDRNTGMSRLAFRDQTAGLLRIPTPDEETIALYKRLCEELFSDAREVVVRDPDRAIRIMARRWMEATRQWGRRLGHKREKLVMNYLSYDCRAAFHRCYSAYWWDARHAIASHLQLKHTDLRLMRLWHFDHTSEAEVSDVPFSWFHGHILGLHPAAGLLTATSIGREILADYLQAESVEDRKLRFSRVLRAVLHAIYVYQHHRDEVRQARRVVA
jgi:hypothetical protein